MKHLRTITRTANVLPAPLKPLTVPVVEASRLTRREVLGRVEGAVVDEHGRLVFFVMRVHANGRPNRKRVLVPLGAVKRLERGMQPALAIAWTAIDLALQPDFTSDDELPRGTWSSLISGQGGVIVSASDMPRPLENAVRWGLPAAALGAIFGFMIWGGAVALALGIVMGCGAAIVGMIVAASRLPAMTDEEEMGTAEREARSSPWVQTLEAELRKSGPYEHGILREATIGPVMQVPG